MPDQTIDAIKVKLGVDASGIKADVDKANAAFKSIGGGRHSVTVEVRPVLSDSKIGTTRYFEALKKGITVPIKVDIKSTGEFGVTNVRKKIQEGLKAGGGVSVPIKIALSAAEATSLRSSIRKAIGMVSVDFQWVASGKPEYKGDPVKVDWTWGDGPDGPPDAGSRGRGRGPRSTPPTPPATPSAGPAPTAGGTYSGPGKGPGESRASASARHKAENEAARAAERAAREEKKAADAAEKAAKQKQQAQRENASTGSTSTGSGPTGAATRRAQKAAEKAAKEAADKQLAASRAEAAAAETTHKAAGSTEQKARTARTARQRELDAEIASSRKAVKEAEATAADARTPGKKAKFEDIARRERERIAALDQQRKAEAARIRAEGRATAAPATPAAGPIGGVGKQTRTRAAKPATGAPTSGGTTSGTTATTPPASGGTMGIDQMRQSRGSQSAKRSNRMSRGGGSGGQWQDEQGKWHSDEVMHAGSTHGVRSPLVGRAGEDLPGEFGPEGARIREARLARVRREMEEAAQAEHKETLRGSVDPHIGGESWDTGDLDEMIPGIQEIFGETDPSKRRTLINDFRLKHSGQGGMLSTGEVVKLDPKKKKRNRRMARRVQTIGGSQDTEFIAQVLGGQSGWQTAVEGWEGANANRVAGARYSGRKGGSEPVWTGGGIAGQRTGAPRGPSRSRPEDIEIPKFGQEYVSEALTGLKGTKKDAEGHYVVDGKPFPTKRAAAEYLGRKKHAEEEQVALGKQQAIRERLSSTADRHVGKSESSSRSTPPVRKLSEMSAEEQAEFHAESRRMADERRARQAAPPAPPPAPAPAIKAEVPKDIKIIGPSPKAGTFEYLDPEKRKQAAAQSAAFDQSRASRESEAELSKLIRTSIGAEGPGDSRFRSTLATFRGKYGQLPIEQQLEKARGIYRPFTPVVTAEPPKAKAPKTAKPKFTQKAKGLASLADLMGIKELGGGGITDAHPAKANNYEWRRTALTAVQKQPWCSYCGASSREAKLLTGKRLNAEHIVPHSKGGSNEPENLRPACSSCNSRTGNKQKFTETWDHPRPSNIANHPKFKDVGIDAFQPGGFLFGVGGLRAALSLLTQHKKKEAKPKKVSGFAEGGYVKHGGLLERMAAAGHEPSIARLGEHGDELAVSDPNTGDTEIVPHHKKAAWLERAQRGQGFAKDLTGHATGGVFKGKLRAEPGSGLRGRKVYRDPFEGERAEIGKGRLSPTGGVNRVFVTNWPQVLTSGAFGTTGGGGTAASSVRAGARAAAGGSRTAAGGTPAAAAGGGMAAAGGGTAAGPTYGTGGRPQMGGPSMAKGRLFDRQMALSEVQSTIAQAKAMTPARAFTTSVAQITENVSGRSGINRRAREAERLTTQANSSLTTEAKIRTDLAKALVRQRELSRSTEPLTKQYASELLKLNEQIPRMKERVKTAAATSQKRGAAAEEAAGGILKPGDVIKTLATGFVGLSVATIAMKAGFAALNAVIDVGSKAMGDWFEMQLGYVNKSVALGNELGQTVKEQDGNTKAVIANTLALSGMAKAAGDMLAPALESRAGTIAGNNALQQRSEMYSASGQFAKGRPSGLPGGFDTNLVKSVGGPFNVGFGPGATAPTAEGLQNFFGQNMDKYSTPQKYLGNANITNLMPGGAPLSETGESTVPRTERTQKAVDFLNKQAEAAGNSLKLVAEAGDETSAAAENTAKVFESIGAGQLAGEIRDKNISANFDQTDPVRARLQAAQWLQSQNTYTPNPGELLGTMGRGLSAGKRAIDRSARIQREQEIPANVALQYISKPMVPYGASTMTNRGQTFGAGNVPTQNLLPGMPGGKQGYAQQSKDYASAFGKYSDMAIGAQSKITAEITKGKSVLQDWGVPDSLIGDIEQVGKDIQQISLGIEQRGLNLTVASYNNELRLANRSLGDAKDMYAGIEGHVKNTLGGLEGQNALLGRQLQLIEQELAQRQINFKLAMAGFTAPGDTPEQRQARIDEAKIEAKYAQEQLNIQKQMTKNQFSVVKITAGRSITDLQAQISLLTEGKSLSIDTAAAQKAIEAMSASEDVLMAKAKTFADAGSAQVKLLNDTITEIETRTGKVFTEWEKDLVSTFSDAGMAFSQSIIDAMNPDTYATQANGGRNDSGHAAGYVGSVSKATRMTVGEAGTEEVAILRNPRQMAMPSGGGGGGGGTVNVNVNISGGGDINEKKLKAWAYDIQKATLDALNRKTSLLGLRSP